MDYVTLIQVSISKSFTLANAVQEWLNVQKIWKLTDCILLRLRL